MQNLFWWWQCSFRCKLFSPLISGMGCRFPTLARKQPNDVQHESAVYCHHHHPPVVRTWSRRCALVNMVLISLINMISLYRAFVNMVLISLINMISLSTSDTYILRMVLPCWLMSHIAYMAWQKYGSRYEAVRAWDTQRWRESILTRWPWSSYEISRTSDQLSQRCSRVNYRYHATVVWPLSLSPSSLPPLPLFSGIRKRKFWGLLKFSVALCPQRS